MTKIHTTLSIEESLMKKAKESGLNISDTLERALSERLVSKKNFKEEDLTVHCSLCKKAIDEGYYCPDKRLILCEACQENYPMRTCPYDKFGEHSHLKWPSIVLKAPNKPIEDKE